MGAYLSHPKTDKVSTDELSERLSIGASSMQGWRNSQEDAHNAIINFDTNTSFFAVYDGHGGAEVATYCADRLPEFLKQLDLYKSGKLEDALRKAFLEFDRTLLEPEVVEVLKILAGDRNVEDSDNMECEEDEEDLVELHEESHLPLNELLEKYKGHPSMPTLSKLRNEAGGSSGNGGSKPQSPYLRGRRTAAIVAQATNKALMDPDSKPQGSSTSAAAAAVMSAACSSDARPSSSGGSKSFEHRAEPVDDTTVSSSSSSGGSEASKTNNNVNSNISNSNLNQGSEAANTNGVATSSSPEAAIVSKPDSSHPSKENGSVTSSEAKAITSAEAVSSKPPADEARVSGSNDDANAAAKQNGSVDSSTKDGVQKMSPNKVDGSTISSTTSKTAKKSNDLTALSGACEDDDDDAEYQLDKSDTTEYSSEDDLEENDDDDDEDADNEEDDENGSDDDDEFDEDVDEDEDDEEAILANQQFCANMIEEPGKDSGCTAVVALLHGRDLYVANAGDSRCVVCRNGKAIEMSLDHKPEDEEESARILKAGGRVTSDGRVNGGLNLSRAIGDHAYKMNADLPLEEQMISARPDIKKLIITPEDEFMVLACDGIWNFMSSDEVVDFVRTRLTKENVRVSEICEELFDHCLAPDTMGDGTGCDNMTAVIVRFQPKLLELPTEINPTETEDALLKQRSEIVTKDVNEEDASLKKKAQKRIASPAKNDNDDENTNEAEQANKTKRLKTDIDELSPNRMEIDQSEGNNKEAGQKIKNLDSCLPTAKSATENSDNIEQNECDSVVSTAAIANAAQTPPIVPAVTTT